MIIGVGGSSRSGKSTLAEALVWHFRQQNARAMVLHQDDFVVAINQLPAIQDRPDWETPASIDFELLRDLTDLYQVRFDVVVVEGLFAFANDALCQRYDRSFFVEISEQTFWTRRREYLRWGPEPDWYLRHVWQSHLRYGQPPAYLSPLLRVSGESEFDPDLLAHFLA
jgi:nicotinamide/nicotinate riboside kinase